jgi:NADH dehydrogenase
VGNEVSPLIKELDLKKNDHGQLYTNPYLQLDSNPEIFALGDGAYCGQTLPATAQVAIQQADYCSWNIWAGLSDRPLMEFKYESLGEMMTLGIDNATMSGLGVKLNGPLAHLARRFVYLYRLPTLEHQINVGLSWLTNPIANLLQPKS